MHAHFWPTPRAPGHDAAVGGVRSVGAIGDQALEGPHESEGNHRPGTATSGFGQARRGAASRTTRTASGGWNAASPGGARFFDDSTASTMDAPEMFLTNARVLRTRKHRAESLASSTFRWLRRPTCAQKTATQTGAGIDLDQFAHLDTWRAARLRRARGVRRLRGERFMLHPRPTCVALPAPGGATSGCRPFPRARCVDHPTNRRAHMASSVADTLVIATLPIAQNRQKGRRRNEGGNGHEQLGASSRPRRTPASRSRGFHLGVLDEPRIRVAVLEKCHTRRPSFALLTQEAPDGQPQFAFLAVSMVYALPCAPAVGA